jgi:hypothetical protein
MYRTRTLSRPDSMYDSHACIYGHTHVHAHTNRRVCRHLPPLPKEAAAVQVSRGGVGGAAGWLADGKRHDDWVNPSID